MIKVKKRMHSDSKATNILELQGKLHNISRDYGEDFYEQKSSFFYPAGLLGDEVGYSASHASHNKNREKKNYS